MTQSNKPSAGLLRQLRALMDARKLNTAAVAQALGRPRGEVRKLLTGGLPLTVDDLVEITQALGLTMEDFGVVVPDIDEEAEPAVPPPSAHWDNQPRALVEFAFELGIDVMLLFDPAQLDDWNGPVAVLQQHKGQALPIQLDAAYHRHMDPGYEDDAFWVTLSFDQLYRCRFPWTAVQRVIFTPFPPSAPEEDAPGPGLRLVT